MLPPRSNGHRLADRPIGELLSRFIEDMSHLVAQEIQLAKAEVGRQVRRAATGAAMFGGALVLALAGIGGLTAAAILGLTEVVDAWLAALIVGGALVVLAIAAGLTGTELMEDVAPPVPDEAVEGVREDVATVADGLEEGRDEARREREMEEALNG